MNIADLRALPLAGSHHRSGPVAKHPRYCRRQLACPDNDDREKREENTPGKPADMKNSCRPDFARIADAVSVRVWLFRRRMPISCPWDYRRAVCRTSRRRRISACRRRNSTNSSKTAGGRIH